MRIEEIVLLIVGIPYIIFMVLFLSSYIHIKMAWDLIKFGHITRVRLK